MGLIYLHQPDRINVDALIPSVRDTGGALGDHLFPDTGEHQILTIAGESAAAVAGAQTIVAGPSRGSESRKHTGHNPTALGRNGADTARLDLL